MNKYTLVEMNHRHKLYPMFKFYIEYNILPVVITKLLTAWHGPENEWVSNGIWGFYKNNPNWQWDIHTRRIYIKNESDFTAIMVQI